MTNDVAIIGVGLHPFGRFDKTAMEMGVDAIGAAVTDAGLDWRDIQFGVGGSWTVANPDAIVGMVGLTGIPFTNVFNACATAASATKACADGIRLGDYDIGIAVGTDKGLVVPVIRDADQILVLVEGVVVERGTHADLLTADGVYADLWAVQTGETANMTGEATQHDG